MAGIAWILFLLIFVVLLVSGIFIGIYKAYGIAGRADVWPIHATVMRILSTATVIGLGVAIFASVASDSDAFTAVIGIWAILVVFGVISIVLTPSGPQELFDRQNGNDKFSMPNRYRPPNEESGGGFAFIVCLEPFDEADRKLWKEVAYVSVKPLEEGLTYFSDIIRWQDNRNKMKPLEPMLGHDQFIFTWALDYDPSKTASNFYLVRYDGDRLARLVRCYGKSEESKCTQYIFSTDSVLMIDSSLWALQHWTKLEDDIGALMARWRINQSPE